MKLWYLFKQVQTISCEVLPLQKGGVGGCGKGFWVVLTQELEVLAILEGGSKKFPSSKTGA